jgi:hypothetical protein
MTPADKEKDDPKKVVEAAPKDIPDRERLKLWVASGGRCAICNEYPLQNEFTGHYVNVGEMAHNVGRQKAEGSARGFADLDISERNKAENPVAALRPRSQDDRQPRDDWELYEVSQRSGKPIFSGRKREAYHAAPRRCRETSIRALRTRRR